MQENQLQKFTKIRPDLSTKLQNLHITLEGKELALQSLLNDTKNSNDINTRENARAAYIHDYNELVKTRKAETEIFDNIKNVLMAFEKRADPKIVLAQFDLETINLKKLHERLIFIKNETEKERILIIDYMTTETAIIEQKYKYECLDRLNELYLGALIKGTYNITEIRQTINNYIPDVISVPEFKTQYLTDAEVKEIRDLIPLPELVFDPETINETFAHFDSDLTHRVLAIEAAKEKEKRQQIEQRKQIAQMQEQTEIQIIVLKPTFKPIKRNLQVVFVDIEQAREVCNQFWINDCTELLNNEFIGNITIQQMANALAKLAEQTGEQIITLNYKVVEK